MKTTVLLLVLVLLASPCSQTLSETKSKSFWERVFTPAKPTPKPVKKRKTSVRKKVASPTPTPTPSGRTSDNYYIVDQQWYSNYVTEEMAWNYWIPEDSDVKFKDGKYHVPPVVYRHYEDMVKARKSSPIPVSL